MIPDLVPKKITHAEIFIPKGLDPLIDGVRKKVKDFQTKDLPLDKKKNREEIISFAAKISKSKVFIDKERVKFVADKKAALKIVDQEGKRFRDTLDELRDEVRKPVTEWENADKARIEQERLNLIYENDQIEAIGMDDLFTREKILEEKEAKIAKQEEEKKQKEESARIKKEQDKEDARLKKEQADREERLKKEAAEKAKLEAEEKIEFEKSEKERIEREAKEAKEKAERDRLAAEKQAKLEKEQAIQKAKDTAKAEADKKEKDRLEIERQKAAQAKIEKEAAEKKAANKRHQAFVNNKILAGLEKLGVDSDTGKKIIISIVKKEIPGLAILY